MYDWKEILEWFSESGIPEPDEILFAEYDQGGYDGQAWVLFVDNGKFYYVEGGHCSCYGLEGQWSPEEYTIETLKGQVERANYGFFKDQKALILEACNRYESPIGSLASKFAAKEAEQKRIQARLSELDAEHSKLTSEYDELDSDIGNIKDQMKRMLN